DPATQDGHLRATWLREGGRAVDRSAPQPQPLVARLDVLPRRRDQGLPPLADRLLREGGVRPLPGLVPLERDGVVASGPVELLGEGPGAGQRERGAPPG